MNLVFDKPEINEVAKADVSTDELLQTLTSVPYLYGEELFIHGLTCWLFQYVSTFCAVQRSTIRRSRGYRTHSAISVIFSTFDQAVGIDAEFEDPYASQLAVYCGVTPFDPNQDSFRFVWEKPSKPRIRPFNRTH